MIFDTILNKRQMKMDFVYFLRSGEYVKIGMTADPENRIRNLISSNPHECNIIGLIACIQILHRDIDAKSLEAGLHKKFLSKRHSGEWFKLTDEECLEEMAVASVMNPHLISMTCCGISENGIDIDYSFPEKVREHFRKDGIYAKILPPHLQEMNIPKGEQWPEFHLP